MQRKQQKTGLHRQLQKSHSDSGDLAITIIVISGFAVFGILVIYFLISLFIEDTNTTEIPVAESNTPAEPVNWQPLVTTLTVAIILGAVFFAVSFIVRKVKALQEQKHIQKTKHSIQMQEWDIVKNRYQELLETVASYETDITKAIKYPAMNDVQEEATAVMMQSLRKARDVFDTVERVQNSHEDEALFEKFSTAVNTFAVDVDHAKSNAKSVALSKLSNHDRKDLNQIRLLLKHASNESNPDQLRHDYMARMKTIVDRINERNTKQVIPAKILTTLEHSTLRQLTGSTV